MLRRVTYCKSPYLYEYWMSMEDMGVVIATIYNMILVVKDSVQMGTLIYCICHYMFSKTLLARISSLALPF